MRYKIKEGVNITIKDERLIINGVPLGYITEQEKGKYFEPIQLTYADLKPGQKFRVIGKPEIRLRLKNGFVINDTFYSHSEIYASRPVELVE